MLPDQEFSVDGDSSRLDVRLDTIIHVESRSAKTLCLKIFHNQCSKTELDIGTFQFCNKVHLA